VIDAGFVIGALLLGVCIGLYLAGPEWP